MPYHKKPNDAPAWQPPPADSVEQDLAAVAEAALQHAAAAGATMAEVSVDQGQGMSVTVRNREVETVEHHRDKSLAVRVFFGQRSGSADTTDFSAEAIRGSVDAACTIAKFTEPDECNGLADADRLARDFPDLDVHHPWAVTMDEAIALAAECEGAALDYDRRISNSEGATLSSHHGVDLFATSDGFRGISRGSRHSIAAVVIAGEGDSMERDMEYDSVRAAGDFRGAAAVGEDAARRTIRRLDARKASTGQYPVLFEPQVAGSLLGHLVRAVSGGSLYRKASFLLDKAGAQIFRDDIRIHEQPHLPRSVGAANFDGEGVATAARDLVAGGVLQGYVLGSYSARKLGLPTTGNAGGVRNLEIAPTLDADFAELCRQMGRGLVVSELIGFGVNTVTGDYSRGGFGFWVEGGEVQYPLHEFTIAGNLAEMFMDVAAVGSDTDRRGNVRSGSVLVEKMTVGGC